VKTDEFAQLHAYVLGQLSRCIYSCGHHIGEPPDAAG
jgi:hypothetical protein